MNTLPLEIDAPKLVLSRGARIPEVGARKGCYNLTAVLTVNPGPKCKNLANITLEII